MTLPDVVSVRPRQVEGLVTRSGGTVIGRVTSDGDDEVMQDVVEQDAKHEQEQE